MNEDVLKQCKEMLPHGMMKIIAKKAGVTTMSVSYFLRGRNKSIRVEKALLEVLAELRMERERLMKDAGLL